MSNRVSYQYLYYLSYVTLSTKRFFSFQLHKSTFISSFAKYNQIQKKLISLNKNVSSKMTIKIFWKLWDFSIRYNLTILKNNDSILIEFDIFYDNNKLLLIQLKNFVFKDFFIFSINEKLFE